jgi:hypothetical protein
MFIVVIMVFPKGIVGSAKEIIARRKAASLKKRGAMIPGM